MSLPIVINKEWEITRQGLEGIRGGFLDISYIGDFKHFKNDEKTASMLMSRINKILKADIKYKYGEQPNDEFVVSEDIYLRIIEVDEKSIKLFEKIIKENEEIEIEEELRESISGMVTALRKSKSIESLKKLEDYLKYLLK